MAIPLTINARFSTRPLSGVDRVAAEMTKALVALTSDAALGLSLEAELPNATVHDSNQLPSSLPARQGYLKGQLWEQVELPQRIGNRWLYSPCNTGPISVRRQVVVIHDAQPLLDPAAYSFAFRNWYKVLLPALARRAKCVVTVSEYSRAQLERLGVVPVGKAHVIHNGAEHILTMTRDSSVLERHGLRPKSYFLAVGNLSPHKNLSLLMRAASARQSHSPELVIVGASNPRVFADAGLDGGGGTRFIGRVSDGELRVLYENAVALAFPSRTEGFGLPPLEAMLCGCPVIASDAGAIPEVCGEAAIFVSPEDIHGWTNAMERIAGDDGLAQQLTRAGRLRASQFTWRSAAIKMLSLVRASY